MKKYSLPLLLTFSCLILYGRSIGFDFLRMDDPLHVSANPYFHPVTFSSFKELWIHPNANLYMPMTFTIWGITSWLSQLSLGKVNPAFFHGLNILTHSLNVILVYFLIHHLLQSHYKSPKEQSKNENRDKWAAFLGTCLFAFHPVQSAAIGWVSGFKDLLLTTFGLLTLFFYLKPKKSALIPFGFYLAALLSKPSAVVFSGNAWLLERTQLKTRRPLWHLGFWLLASTMIILITQNSQPINFTPIPFWQRPFIALDSLGFYLQEIFWPVDISSDHGRTPTHVLQIAPTWFMILPVIIGCIIVVIRKSLPKNFLTALAFFLVALLPVSGLIHFNFQYISSVADYYIYFPMIGLAWALSLLIQQHWKRGTLITAASLAVILFVWSWINLPIWKNTESQALNTIRKNPNSCIANQDLGNIEITRNNLPKALEYLEVANHIRGDIITLSDIAIILDHMNRLGELEKRLKDSFENIKKQTFDNDNDRTNAANIALMLTKIYISRGEMQNTFETLAFASKCSSKHGKIHYDLAQLYEATGNTTQASAEFHQACELEPTNTVFSTRCQ